MSDWRDDKTMTVRGRLYGSVTIEEISASWVEGYFRIVGPATRHNAVYFPEELDDVFGEPDKEDNQSGSLVTEGWFKAPTQYEFDAPGN